MSNSVNDKNKVKEKRAKEQKNTSTSTSVQNGISETRFTLLPETIKKKRQNIGNNDLKDTGYQVAKNTEPERQQAKEARICGMSLKPNIEGEI